MSIYLLDDDDPCFPPARLASRDGDGILAVGGDYSVPRLLEAYAGGIFPWSTFRGRITWHSPDPRFVLLPENFKIPRSLQRVLKKHPFKITVDRAFDQVIAACAAAPRPEGGTWINDQLRAGYRELHRAGFAHSALRRGHDAPCGIPPPPRRRREEGPGVGLERDPAVSEGKLGLVLEGGGMRGLFTAGVLDALYDMGVRFDGIMGVSAGAAFGCNYKSQQPGRVLRYNLCFCRDRRYWGLGSLLRTGDLFNAEFCYRTLPKVLDPWDGTSFAADPTEFWAVATDADTGEPVYPKLEEADEAACEWIRASSSMPLVSRPVCIDGHRYLDGGMSDSIPLAKMQSLGFKRNVVILTRPAGYRKGPARLWPFRPWLRRLPAVEAALRRRPAEYNRAVDFVEAEEAKGRVFVFRPQEELPIGRVSRSRHAVQAAYDLGKDAAVRARVALRDWLAVRKPRGPVVQMRLDLGS